MWETDARSRTERNRAFCGPEKESLTQKKAETKDETKDWNEEDSRNSTSTMW